jgi:hypothetical protein
MRWLVGVQNKQVLATCYIEMFWIKREDCFTNVPVFRDLYSGRWVPEIADVNIQSDQKVLCT